MLRTVRPLSQLVVRSTGRCLYSSYSSIPILKTKTEFDEAIKQDKLTVVDFYATWCMPCKAMAPHLSKLVSEYSDVAFYKVDVDESHDIASKCEVTAMPTFVLTKNGEVVSKIVGANPRGLEEGINEYK